jgi:hypothetical protein
MVEGIEQFHTNLEVEGFADRRDGGSLDDAEVLVDEPGRIEAEERKVSILIGPGMIEAGRSLARCAQHGPTGPAAGGHQTGTRVEPEDAIRGLECPNVLFQLVSGHVTQHRGRINQRPCVLAIRENIEGRSAAHARKSLDVPAADKLVDERVDVGAQPLTPPERQGVQEVGRERMQDVIRRPILVKPAIAQRAESLGLVLARQKTLVGQHFAEGIVSLKEKTAGEASSDFQLQTVEIRPARIVHHVRVIGERVGHKEIEREVRFAIRAVGSPPKRMVWRPLTQAKLSDTCRTGVLRPCGKLFEVRVGSVSIPPIGSVPPNCN